MDSTTAAPPPTSTATPTRTPTLQLFIDSDDFSLGMMTVAGYQKPSVDRYKPIKFRCTCHDVETQSEQWCFGWVMKLSVTFRNTQQQLVSKEVKSIQQFLRYGKKQDVKYRWLVDGQFCSLPSMYTYVEPRPYFESSITKPLTTLMVMMVYQYTGLIPPGKQLWELPLYRIPVGHVRLDSKTHDANPEACVHQLRRDETLPVRAPVRTKHQIDDVPMVMVMNSETDDAAVILSWYDQLRDAFPQAHYAEEYATAVERDIHLEHERARVAHSKTMPSSMMTDEKRVKTELLPVASSSSSSLTATSSMAVEPQAPLFPVSDTYVPTVIHPSIVDVQPVKTLDESATHSQ